MDIYAIFLKILVYNSIVIQKPYISNRYYRLIKTSKEHNKERSNGFSAFSNFLLPFDVIFLSRKLYICKTCPINIKDSARLKIQQSANSGRNW